MSSKFDLFRFSLISREQGDVFGDRTLTKEQYLRNLFSKKHQFTHREKQFHYVPEPIEHPDGIIIGRVGRIITMDENLPPEKGFQETQHKAWKALIIIIDPKAHDDGQKIAFENDVKVGKTNAIMLSLVNTLNEQNPEAIYHLEISSISKADTFWEFARKNKGAITNLTFIFITPNMFGGTDEIEKELKRYQKEEKAQEVNVNLKSDVGIDTNTDRIKSSVEYTTRGGGDIIARTKDKQYYSSRKKIMSTIINNGSESLLDTVIKFTSKVLGRGRE